MNNNYYYEQDYKYTERAEIIGSDGDSYKVRIGAMMPKLDDGSAKKQKKPKNATNKILNKDGRKGVKAVTTANYVLIEKPEGAKYKKGDKVLISFPGGEINMPVILCKI